MAKPPDISPADDLDDLDGPGDRRDPQGERKHDGAGAGGEIFAGRIPVLSSLC
jgi:hypothetical protein